MSDKARVNRLEDVPIGSLMSNAARRLRALEIASFSGKLGDAPLLTLLWHVANEPGREMSFYAWQMSIDLATFGRHVATLVDAGELHKSTDKGDSRRRMLRLTDSGYARLHAQREAYRDFEKRQRAAMGAARYDRMVVLMKYFLQVSDAVLPSEPEG